MILFVCVALEPISKAYFVNQSVCLYVYVVRQRLGKNVTTATNTHGLIELLEASFYMLSMSIKGEFVDLSVYLPIVVRQRLGKHIPTEMSCWRSYFLCSPCRIKRKWGVSSSQNFLLRIPYHSCLVHLYCIPDSF
jgi:hypothetical protein